MTNPYMNIHLSDHGHLEPSKAFMIKALGCNESPFRVNFSNVLFGKKFKEDLMSTNTWDMILSIHFIEMYRALLCAFPSIVSSSSLKPRQLPVVIFLTTPSN